MTDTIIDTNVLPDSTGGHPNGQVGTTHSSASGDGVRNAVRSILGDRVRLSEMMSLGNLDYHTGYAHTTTSLPYAIHGTATVVSRKVALLIVTYTNSVLAHIVLLIRLLPKLPPSRIPSRASWVLQSIVIVKSSSSVVM